MTTTIAHSHTNPTATLFLSALMVSLGLINAALMYFMGPLYLAMEGMSGNASVAATYAGLVIGIGLSVWFGFRPHLLSICLAVGSTIAAMAGLYFLTASLLGT